MTMKNCGNCKHYKIVTTKTPDHHGCIDAEYKCCLDKPKYVEGNEVCMSWEYKKCII